MNLFKRRVFEVAVAVFIALFILGAVSVPLWLVWLTGLIDKSLPEIILMVIGAIALLMYASRMVYWLLIEPFSKARTKSARERYKRKYK